jgi:hypothetical protein
VLSFRFYKKVVRSSKSKGKKFLGLIIVSSRLKGQCHEIFSFFQESVFPKLLSITLGPFRIFSKIRGDIRISRLTTGINDPGGKFANGFNDNGGKIAAGINDTGGKFATGINDPADTIPLLT